MLFSGDVAPLKLEFLMIPVPHLDQICITEHARYPVFFIDMEELAVHN